MSLFLTLQHTVYVPLKIWVFTSLLNSPRIIRIALYFFENNSFYITVLFSSGIWRLSWSYFISGRIVSPVLFLTTVSFPLLIFNTCVFFDAYFHSIFVWYCVQSISPQTSWLLAVMIIIGYTWLLGAGRLGAGRFDRVLMEAGWMKKL